MDHTCDENGNIVLNVEKTDITYIHSINSTNNVSMNEDDKYNYKYYAPFLSSKNHEDVSSSS